MRFDRCITAAATLLPLAALGCSDPVPPTPDGAWTLNFVQQSALECDIFSHNAQVGIISSDSRTKVITDGTEGARVSCEVTGSGTFKAKGKASQNGYSLEILIPAITADASPESPADGQIAYSSTKETVSNTYVAEKPCAFYFQPDTKEGVDTGKIWVAFQCDEIVFDTSKCQISQGYAIFENCTTDAAE
jgi:hypothetical protein